jgi:hypothetical protein
MKAWRALWCFLLGHTLYGPTAGVERCGRCDQSREWGQRLWSQREVEGVLGYPLNFLRETISKQVQVVRSLKAHLFCHHCGGLILHRVDQHFCSEKCEQEWFPF